MRFRWSPAPAQPLLVGQLAKALQISPLLAQCILNRGLGEPEAISRFLHPRLKDLSDPFLLPDMPVAIDRLFQARERAEPLVIFGDYDVDGVTATALLLEALRPLGWMVDAYLPHRLDEGYGLSHEAVENCLRRFPVKLMLAVDCGSTAVATIADLRQRGVDVVVLDHHQVASPAPAATALVNPQVAISADGNAGAPAFGELCSAGLAFKLAHALVKRGRATGVAGAAEFDLRPLLDLVALGTIADLVPLTGENRILVNAGLDRLNRTQRPGLLALKEVAQCATPLTGYEVGFQLAPRLNAAGRLETAEAALQLLMARDFAEALRLARNLDACNRERQKIERGICENLFERVRAKFKPENDFVIVEGEPSWHVGVVGIVAARVLQQFYRPTIVVGGESEEWRGSGRSIAGFDLAGALRECGDLLVRHGGHAMAAGLAINRSNVNAFRERLNDLARRALKAEELQPALRLDAEVGLDEVTLEALAQISRMRPVGQGNPPVQFFSRNLVHHRPLQRVGAEKQHVKMWLSDGAIAHEAIWWGAGAESLPVGRFDLAFVPQVHQYNGLRSVQLKVLDWRAAVNP
jgi:single-stranded-DNA-specific exonuclease